MYVLLDFPGSIIHDVNGQKCSLLEHLSDELLLIVLNDLPILDRINIALTAKRYLALMKDEELLHVDSRDMNLFSSFVDSKDLVRIASPPMWIAAELDTDMLRRKQEIEVMMRLIPFLTHKFDINKRTWRLRVKITIERVGGLATKGLLTCIKKRAKKMYAADLNGYWWHEDVHAEDDEKFWDFTPVELCWITGLPWGDPIWDESYAAQDSDRRMSRWGGYIRYDRGHFLVI